MLRSSLHPLGCTLLVLSLLGASSCGGSPPASKQLAIPEATASPEPGTAHSNSGKYRITIVRHPTPLPINKMHSWNLHVLNKRGRGVRDADFALRLSYPNGPAPQHQPKMRQHLGGGRYTLEGLHLPAAAGWRLEIDILRGGDPDTVVFEADAVLAAELPLSGPS